MSMESRSPHSTNARWVVVNTQPHRESLALTNLEQQKFSTYCPMMRKTVRHARKAREVLRPLFPGYIFVQVDPKVQRWRPLLSTYGVRSIVGSGERLSFLDAGFIESLKAREVEGVIERPRQPYRIGQEVKLAGGAFEGLVATIIDMDEKDRLVVLLDLLNRPVKVKLHAGGVSEA